MRSLIFVFQHSLAEISGQVRRSWRSFIARGGRWNNDASDLVCYYFRPLSFVLFVLLVGICICTLQLPFYLFLYMI